MIVQMTVEITVQCRRHTHIVHEKEEGAHGAGPDGGRHHLHHHREQQREPRFS